MSIAVFASCAVLATFVVFLHLAHKFLYTPIVLARCLKRQGIPGCLFRPVVGQIPDIRKVFPDLYLPYSGQTESIICISAYLILLFIQHLVICFCLTKMLHFV